MAQTLDELDLAVMSSQFSFDRQQGIPLEDFCSSRQLQQSTTPRQDHMDLLDVMGPLYRRDVSPPLATPATIRANSVPTLRSSGNVWGAIARQKETTKSSAEEPPSWANSAGKLWNSGLPTPFASEEPEIEEPIPGTTKTTNVVAISHDKESLQSTKFEVDPAVWTAQSESPPPPVPSVSPVGSETSNNTSETPVSRSTEGMLTTLEDLDLESTPMSKAPEPVKTGEHVMEELKRVRTKLEETKRKLAETEEQLEKTKEVAAGLRKVIDLESEVKTKFSRLPQYRNNKCANCIERLKAFDSCKNCIKRS